MVSAIFELVIFSLPSLIWTRRLKRTGSSRAQALGAVGLQAGTRSGYALALALVIPVRHWERCCWDWFPARVARRLEEHRRRAHHRQWL